MSNALFDADEYGEPIRLRDRYIVPPFTVLERRGGWWQGRRRMYVDAGIASNIGREGVRTFGSDGATDDVSMKIDAVSGGLSIFDPVLSEIINRWWMVPDAIVVDPFAGGSVRGIVSGMWGRHYIGIDISPKQLTANRQQKHAMRSEIAPGTNVTWIDGDAMDELRSMPDGTATGGVYTCPPYYDLEVYTDDPRDISTWEPDRFDAYMADLMVEQFRVQGDDTFAVWVVGEVRNRSNRNGSYRGFVPKTIQWHVDAGYGYFQEAILVDPAGTAQLRAAGTFDPSRKLISTHQNVLVFVKGDARAAATKIGKVTTE